MSSSSSSMRAKDTQLERSRPTSQSELAATRQQKSAGRGRGCGLVWVTSNARGCRNGTTAAGRSIHRRARHGTGRARGSEVVVQRTKYGPCRRQFRHTAREVVAMYSRWQLYLQQVTMSESQVYNTSAPCNSLKINNTALRRVIIVPSALPKQQAKATRGIGQRGRK